MKIPEQLESDFHAPEECEPPGLSFDDPDLTVTFDLPLRWDGQAVTWDEVWEETVIPFICPPPKDKRTCECGSTWPSLTKKGHTDTFRLTVNRCVDCREDTIIDSNHQWWTLGPEDYGPEGSYLITDLAPPSSGASII